MSFVDSPPGIAWRLPIACQMIFAFIVIAMVFGLPESPRYCYQKGRQEEALKILCDVYDGTPETPTIAREQAEILEALEVEREQGEYKWRNILVKDKVQTGRRVLLAYGSESPVCPTSAIRTASIEFPRHLYCVIADHHQCNL